MDGCIIVNPLPKFFNFGQKPFKNIVGKEQNAVDQHFLLIQQCISLYQVDIPQLEPPMSSESSLNLEKAKFWLSTLSKR